MSTTLSPNMNLPVPGVGNEDGPQWATDLNNSLGLIDAHNHSAGSGVQITPSGLNINTDLSFAGNSATNVYSVDFSSQSAAISGINFASVVGGNLYFNDGSGNQIQITSGGGVAGSPGNIGSLAPPAAATYSVGNKTFIWTSDSSKSAAMDNGAVTIRETDVAAAKGISIQSPSALASDYALTLPASLPASTQYLTSTSAGLLSFSTSNQIAAAATRSTGTTVSAGGVAISASVDFSTASNSLVDVTNSSVTITTSGRPVMIMFGMCAAGDTPSINGIHAGSPSVSAGVTIVRNATTITNFAYVISPSATQAPIIFIDAVAAGTYTYKLQAFTSTASITIGGRLFVYEL